MGPFLLDANVLIALAWPRHEFHARVGIWFEHHSRAGWASCPFTQAAFVRVLCNPAFSTDALTPQNAVRLLEVNLNLPNHEFWPDSITLPQAFKGIARLTGHQQITDGYLLGMAMQHKAKLATMDRGVAEWGVPGAVELIA